MLELNRNFARLRDCAPTLIVALLLSGCQYLPFGFTPIGEISAKPAAFEGRQIKIHGKVTDVTKIPFVDVRGYMLRDDSGSIVVITQTSLPSIGQELALSGQVENALIIGGQSFGFAFREVERLPVFL